MKYQSCILITFALLFVVSLAQDIESQSIYIPFTQQELTGATQTMSAPQIPMEPMSSPAHPPQGKHYKKYKHQWEEEQNLLIDNEQEEFQNELTDQEKEDRRKSTKRYHKIFKYGLLIGTGLLSIIIFKFCIAKRKRNTARREQMRNQIMTNPNGQAILYNNMQPQTFPQQIPSHPQVFQMARFCPQQQQQQHQQPQQLQAQVVRGRPHDSFIRENQIATSPSVQAQIRFHENEILRLKEMKSQCPDMRRNVVPINTTESFEYNQPIQRYRNIPVGQPFYNNKDANSSFASQYPEI